MLSQKDLHEIFEYKNGKLYNRYNRGVALKGREAGCKQSSGYYAVGIKRKIYYLHRVIWIMFNGDIPSGLKLDHKNHRRDDNRIEFLRLVTSAENGRNQKLSANNTSGINGVCWDKGRNKWAARIRVDGKYINLGRFINKDNAIAVRKQAEIKYGFYENHGK